MTNHSRSEHLENKESTKKSLEVDSNASVEFTELFPRSFMEKYTTTSDIYTFFRKGGFQAEKTEDFAKISEQELTIYISKNTSFQSWSEMLGLASNEFVLSQFDTLL